MNVGNWTPEQRAELVAVVREQAVRQIECDAELRDAVDWMLDAVGVPRSPEAYRLVFLVSAVLTAGEQR